MAYVWRGGSRTHARGLGEGIVGGEIQLPKDDEGLVLEPGG